MFLRTVLKSATAALLSAFSGCVEYSAGPNPAPPPLLTEPIGIQLTRTEPRFAGVPFRVLLDFERPSDLAFVVPQSAGLQCSTDQAHTGRSSLQIGPGGGFGVKLGSLLSGGAFPGKWTIAGAYFRGPANGSSAKVTIAYRSAASAAPIMQRTVEVSGAGRWTSVFLDLTSLAGPAADVGLLTFQVESSQAVYCDDVLLANNNRTLDAPAPDAPPGSAWSIRENGLTITVERPGHFRVALKTPEAAPDGWAIEEASDLRARFVSPGGKTWTIYSDGRQYQDGVFSTLVALGDAAPLYVRQHATPADLSVPEEFGRIDRDTPGDKNNDGYNERRGSYQLAAKGPRFEVTLKPNTRLLTYPILEISGLPKGSVLVTIEGQLIEKTTRLANGNLLVRVPVTLERATTINILVK